MPELQQTESFPGGIQGERPGYFAVCGASLYTVLHQVEKPVARILLVGPFTLERHTSYRAWVQWARYLASQGNRSSPLRLSRRWGKYRTIRGHDLRVVGR